MFEYEIKSKVDKDNFLKMINNKIAVAQKKSA